MKLYKEDFVLNGSDGLPITLDIRYDLNKQSQPVVLFVHGFKGFKDWGTFNQIADRFVVAGYCFVKFNFSHNGVTPDDQTAFGNLEAFGKNTFTKELYDLDKVLNWLVQTKIKNASIDMSQLTLIGFSRGGGTAILKSSMDQRIKRLITWASVSDYRVRFTRQQLEAWKREGVLYIPNARTNQQMPLYKSLYDDFVTNEDRYTISKALSLVDIPHLILHGEEDETVSVNEASQLKGWSRNSKLITIPNAGHTFNGAHPWNKKELPKETTKLLEHSFQFLVSN